MWLAVLALALIAGAFAAIHGMHMFQLNSYNPWGHLRWLGRHRGGLISPIVVLLLGVATLVWPLPVAIVLAIWLALAAWLGRPRRSQAKKPLVYTARVIRMFATIAVLMAALVVATTLTPDRWRYLVAVLPFVLSPLWVIVANAINAPIEAGVRRHYLNDAKRILASHQSLIKIGITGSFGKTSVKYYLATLLKGHFSVLMTPESYNTPMGVTKTIRADLRATHEVFVCEMGAKRPGDIAELCDLVHPGIGVITAIGEQHLETFGSQAAILATKLELARSVAGSGLVYLNGDNDILRANQPDQPRQLYGLRPDNDTYAYDLAVGVDGTTFALNHRGTTLAGLTTPLIGAHAIQNLAGAIAVAIDLGVTETELRAQLRRLAPAPHRLAMSHQGGVTIIDDAYNSNPAGAKAALDTLCLFDGIRILITPGMVELGERQDALNQEFGAQAAVCDHVYLVGAKQTGPIAKGLLGAGYDTTKLTVVEDVRAALSQAYALPGAAKAILLENDLPDNY